MDLFDGLGAEERRQFLASGRHRRFAAREVVFHEGDPADSMLLIQRGRLAVRMSTAMGDAVTLAVLGPGEIVGELAMIDPEPTRSASVVALEATEVWSIHRDALTALRAALPGVDTFMMRTLSATVRRLSGLLLDSLFMPVETRVLRRLADLERQYADGSATTTIPLTQDQIASLAGASRVTVNQVLQGAAADGLVELRRGRILVLRPDELAARAG